ncbi:MAG: hypothetical protein DRQ88_01690 [Epsilonproteobacteria bacterium]|nr:MAG: hypothetical protein DRQ89_06365 [Campylobacterota bacterium]RLA67789.1 MAG: hypothetical protein DRQ88_01690 [Campylobacterota bacterium]
MTSTYLNQRELKGFLKLADVMIPGEGDLPSFSSTNFVNFIDLVLEEVNDTDLGDLKFLFGLLAIMPNFLIHWSMLFVENFQIGPDFLKGNLAKIEIGLKGIIYSLYYSRLPDHNADGDKIFKVLGWETNIPGLQKQNNTQKEKELCNGGERPAQFL